MPAAIFPVAAYEVEPPRISVEEGRETRSRKYFCPTADVETMLSACMPINLRAGTEVVRRAPTTYPGKDYLLLTSIEFAPVDSDGISGKDDNDVAKPLSGVFATLRYSTKPRMDFSINSDPGAEFLRLPATDAMTWTNSLSGSPSQNKMTADSVIHKVIPVRNFTVLWRNVPRPNWTALDNNSGTVNFAVFLGCEPESLLFLGATTQERVNSAGDVVYDISSRFSKRWIPYTAPGGLTAYAGWNHVYRPDVVDPDVDHQWQQTTPAIYQSSPFADLFKLGDVDLRKQFMDEVGWRDLSK